MSIVQPYQVASPIPFTLEKMPVDSTIQKLENFIWEKSEMEIKV
ncbi:MAG: hypothetical protein V3T40_01305 [Nitrososphaerales archaeon]